MSGIIAFVNDLLFRTKIEETAKHNNVEVTFVKNRFELFDHLSKKTMLIIFDLNNKNLDLNVIKEIKSNQSLSKIRMIGFLPHVNADLRNKALELGFDKVYARSEFSKKLAEII